MKKIYFAIVIIIGVLILGTGLIDAQTVFNQPGTPTKINIVKHMCPANIQSQADFDALGSFFNKVNVCPTITYPGNVPTSGARTGNQYFFAFTIVARNTANQIVNYTQPDFFNPNSFCQNVTTTGMTTTNYCLDTSGYLFTNIPSGGVSIYESRPVAGTRLGAIEFTPTTVRDNNDRDTLLNISNGIINLNTLLDRDNDITIHAFDFIGTTGFGIGSPAGVMPINQPAVGVGTTPQYTREQTIIRISMLISVIQELINLMVREGITQI